MDLNFTQSKKMSASNSDPNIASAAEKLLAAASTGVACAPVRPLIENFGLDGAYAVQDILTTSGLKDGRAMVGRKIGLTSKSVQQQLGVDQPDYGMLFADMEVSEGQDVTIGRFISPRVEAEIAFVVGRDIDDETIGLAGLIQSIEYAIPSIEIVDSRIADWKISIFDTIADNASSGAFVLGGAPKRLDSLDLRLCGMVLERAGEPLATGCGAACLGNPLNAALWLARKMAAVGRPLRAGNVVLSGALGPMVAAESGARYTARISGLGSVSIGFTSEPAK
jgi:2-keto-4-pentenoate hydratase